jgi:hypothetical protein
MIGVVHELDKDAWIAVNRGERLIDWELWFGHPDGADYLTDEGKRTRERAVSDLTTFFGPKWLDQALRPDPGHGQRIQGLGVSAPILAPTPERRAGYFIESIRWWASLQLLAEKDVQGFRTVRRDVRHDLKADRLIHTLTQSRLAAIGMYLGADVALEPGKSGGPGDVLLRTPDHDIFLEIVTFGPDPSRELDEAYQNRHWMHLADLSREDIHWDGYVPGFLNRADEERWLRATREAAAECVRTGLPVEILGPDDQRLVVKPDPHDPGTGTHGPHLDLDFSAKLAARLDRKGAQTRGAGVAWIWLEDYGGVHPIHPFSRSPLASKIAELGDIVRPALIGHSHVAGAVWSKAQASRPPLPRDETERQERGLAFQRGLPIEHLRRSVIINRSLILPGQTRLLAQVCDREPAWLDWALGRLGIGDGVGSLVIKPLESRPSSLWTPPERG